MARTLRRPPRLAQCDGPVSGLTAVRVAFPPETGSGCRQCLHDAACAVYRCGGSAGMARGSRTGFPISPGSHPGHLSTRAIVWRRPQAGQAAFDEAQAGPQSAGMANSARLDTALEAARRASALIRAAYGQAIPAQEKDDGSPVTEADIAAEHAIRETVQSRFPDDGFYGEETAADRLDAEHLWLVDPIDGTKSFVRGYPMFSTQIAWMKRGQLQLGVSCAPAYGETAWAERGAGAFMDGKPLAVSRVARIERATLSTGNLRSLAGRAQWDAFGRLVQRLDRIRGFGDFLHYHLLAAGKIDVVLESDIHVLDIAALTVIVEEAGGRVTDLEGAPVGLDTRSILASNGLLHEPVLEALGG